MINSCVTPTQPFPAAKWRAAHSSIYKGFGEKFQIELPTLSFASMSTLASINSLTKAELQLIAAQKSGDQPYWENCSKAASTSKGACSPYSNWDSLLLLKHFVLHPSHQLWQPQEVRYSLGISITIVGRRLSISIPILRKMWLNERLNKRPQDMWNMPPYSPCLERLQTLSLPINHIFWKKAPKSCKEVTTTWLIVINAVDAE